MAKDVKFNIKLSIDGKEHVIEASTNVKKLAEELGIAKTKSDEMRNALLTINNAAQSFQNVVSGLQQITGLMHSYTAANAVQVEVEAKLANNMRNTMGARDEDIQSIKDLCAAQQRLGVIGDEVQLAGAQELATYLEKKSSLEQLIPVMNDMVAQQYGLNATSEAATNIATMLGKVMDGQVGALSRYGYKFDEAQAQILKFGTEEQRAAVLAEVVESSVGGMNAELAKTDAGRAKQAANAIGDLKEEVGALFRNIEPAIVAVGEMGMALMAVGTTYNGIKGVIVGITGITSAAKSSVVATYAQAAAGKVAAAVQALWALQLRYGQQANIAWAFSAKLATVQAVAMRTAILGLMAVTGIGLAFVAVSSIISLFSDNAEDAAGATGEMSDAMRKAEIEGKKMAEAQSEENQAAVQAASTLSIYKEKLENLVEAKKKGHDISKEEKKIVGELNNAYGDTMGYFSNVSDWYKALIANSEDYCRQMVLEAKTRRLANEIAEKETALQRYQETGETPAGAIDEHLESMGVDAVTGGGGAAESWARQQQRDINSLTESMKKAATEASNIQFKVKGSKVEPTNTTKGSKNGKEDKQLIENAKTYKDLANNVAYYQQELEKCDITDTERIVTLAKAKKAAEDAVKAFKDMTDAATMPVELNTLDDYDKKLNALRNDRKTASKEHIAQIDAEIERIEAAKQALEDESVAALKDEEIRTYDQLNKKLAYYNRLLKSGDATQREFAQQGINRLNKLQEAWDEALDAMSLPTTTNNLKDIDAAISFYTARQQKEDADQIQKTQAIIDGLTAKKKALQLGIELPNMQREVDEINALTGKEYRIKIKAMGFDGIADKIREINKLMKNPDLTGGQMAQLEALRKSYAEWAKDAVRSFSTYRKGWDGVKGIGGGIEGITNALEGNGNAWQTLTGIVDGFLQIYDGISGIVELVNMLTMATNLQTGAKEAETAATAAGTAATIADTAAVGADTAATMANTAAKSGEAVADATAEGAKMPFPLNLVAIAAGVAAVLAALAMAGSFATGGVVGGNSPTGDKLLARVNSGEMILNKRQQLRLLQMLSGQRKMSYPDIKTPDVPKIDFQFDRNMLQPAAGGMSGPVRFEIDGRKLVGVMANETRVSSKSGKKTNIKIG